VTWRANIHSGLVTRSFGSARTCRLSPAANRSEASQSPAKPWGEIRDALEGVVLPDARAGREYACFPAGARAGWAVKSYLQLNEMRDLIPAYRRRQLRDPV
jgi:hypothetical protein